MTMRDRFFLPEPTTAVELRAFTHGLMPRTVPGLMAQFTNDWQRLGVDAWNEVPNHWRPGSGERVGWWSLPVYLGDHFIAPLLQAPAGSCIHQPNVHWTIQCLFSAPETFARKRGVVLTEAEFPSTLHSAQQWAALLDLDLTLVPLGSDGFVDGQRVLDAITEETALVLLSHVGFTTGEKLTDAFLQAVARRVHESGGVFVVDGYHATGSVPVDVTALEVDGYVGGLLKEACGSAGNAFAYFRPGLSLTPRLSGWFGDADPFGFQTTPKPHAEVRRRFLGGTSAVASMYHAVEGVRVLLDAGLDAVRADSLTKTAHALRRADETGLRVRSPRHPERRGATVILEAPAADRLCAYLKTRHVYTDSRKRTLLRLAPFVWNTFDELDRAFDLIAEALRTGEYRTFDGRSAGPVT